MWTEGIMSMVGMYFLPFCFTHRESVIQAIKIKVVVVAVFIRRNYRLLVNEVGGDEAVDLTALC